MKFKIIATACAALCAASAFAAPLDTKTQAPQLTFYIGGSSAQGSAVTAVAPDLFATPADVVTVTQSGGEAATGFYGMSKASLTGNVSQRLLVVYNSTNGSAAGVAQLVSITNPSPVLPDTDVLTVGTAACTQAAGATTASCTSHAPTAINMALSDVNIGELFPGVVPSGAGYLTPSQLTITKTALQGFGVIVNQNLYNALQAANVADGTLPSSCTGSALTTPACQPSIRRADYSSLINVEGSVKSAAQLLRNPADSTVLTLVRRDDSSGTQASANLFFSNNICGTAGYQGYLTPVQNNTTLGGSIDDSVPGVFQINEQTGTTGVKNTVGGDTTGYSIGVIGMGNAQGSTWKYVKLDGVSPNYLPLDGATDPHLRQAFASGRYPFAYEMFAMYQKSASTINKNLATTMIAGLSNSIKHNLNGIAYLDNPSAYSANNSAAQVAAGENKQSYVNRGGNACQPLVN